MDQRDVLMTFAELSLALGGFIGIVLVLRSRSDLVVGVPRPLLESILLVVFGAAIIPVVCIATLNFGTDPSVAYRIGSFLMVAATGAWFAIVAPRLIRSGGLFTTSTLPVSVFGISAIHWIAQALNVFGMLSPHTFAVMFAGLAWYFISGTIAFSSILISIEGSVFAENEDAGKGDYSTDETPSQPREHDSKRVGRQRAEDVESLCNPIDCRNSEY